MCKNGRVVKRGYFFIELFEYDVSNYIERFNSDDVP